MEPLDLLEFLQKLCKYGTGTGQKIGVYGDNNKLGWARNINLKMGQASVINFMLIHTQCALG